MLAVSCRQQVKAIPRQRVAAASRPQPRPLYDNIPGVLKNEFTLLPVIRVIHIFHSYRPASTTPFP